MNKDLQIAKKTVQTEIQALKKLSASLNRSSQFSRVVNLISKTKGKCLVVGVGKSYIVGLKVASTLSSLGTQSIAFSANDLQKLVTVNTVLPECRDCSKQKLGDILEDRLTSGTSILSNCFTRD